MIRPIGPEEYDQLCGRIGTVVQEATPAEAIVAVVSKGDSRLVEFEGRRGLHFPGDVEGGYAGYHPHSAEEAIAQLEAARQAGAEYLCLPATAFWWLDHYGGLGAWLGVHCRVVVEDRQTCIVYDLLRSPGEKPSEDSPPAVGQVRSLLDSLLPAGAQVFAIGFEPAAIGSPDRTIAPLGGINSFGLRRRLESDADRPTYLLIARGASQSPLDPELERVIDSATRPVAVRPQLCELRTVKNPAQPSRIDSDAPIAGGPPGGPSLDGEAVDKLSKRLERLGLAGDDGGSSAATGKGNV